MAMSNLVDIPDVLIETHDDAVGRAWIADLPRLIADSMDQWALELDGPAMCGMASLVLPVTCVDGTAAALKLQPVNDENIGEPLGLQAWDGDGSVRLLDHDPNTCTLLLERLDEARPLSSVTDEVAAVQVLAELMARLVEKPAPAGLRRLADVAATMLDDVPQASHRLADPDERKLVRSWASGVSELVDDAGDRLLHWDLHYDNILAARREPWLAIDPKPLAGDPGFDLFPALDNRWDIIVASGDVPRAILRRFDQLTEVVGLDRQRAMVWTLGRALQNALWDIEDGKRSLPPVQVMIATTLASR